MLNPIRIVFQHIADGVDKVAYINGRLDLLISAYEAREAFCEQPDDKHCLNSEHRAALVRLVINSQFVEPELASMPQHPQMDTDQQVIADERIECAIDTIHTANPLLPGEQLQSQVQSYLQQPYLGYPPRTGVIYQVTNKAVLYFFFLDCQIESKGDVIWVPPRDRDQKALYSVAIDRLANEGDGKTILKEKLAQGLKQLIPVPYNSLVVN